MFRLLLTFLLFTAIVCEEDKSSEDIIFRYNSLKEFLESNKLAVARGQEQLEKQCPGIQNKLKTAVSNFMECEQNYDDTLTICQIIQSATLNCSAPVVKVITECLPEKAQDLPILSIRSFVSVAGYLCEILGESIFELANPCLWDEFDESNKEECEKNLLTFISEHKESLPSAIEICTVAAKLRNCAQEHGGLSKCRNQKTKDAVKGFADALLAPCSQINDV